MTLFQIFFIFFLFCIQYSKPQNNLFVKTLAGYGPGGYNGDGFQATAAFFNAAGRGNPWVDSSGYVYVPDAGNFRVRRIDLSGIISTIAGSGVSGAGGGNGPATFIDLQTPYSVVGDATGFYLADGIYVWRYTFNSGNLAVYAGNGAPGFSGDGAPAISAQFNIPCGLWLTTSNVLYIADYTNNRIRKVNAGLQISTIAGSGSPAGYCGDNGVAFSACLNHPTNVYVDTTGKVFIVDSSNGRIRVVDTNSIITTFAGTGTPGYNGDNIAASSATLNIPLDVKGDNLGNIYISDHFNSRIRRVDSAGIISTFLGSRNAETSLLPVAVTTTTSVYSPTGLWLDSQSNLYFMENGVVLRRTITFTSLSPTVSPTSSSTKLLLQPVAGLGGSGYSGNNGPATVAQMKAQMIYVDPNDFTYVAENNNARVRKITPSGIMTGFGGTGTSATTGVGGPINAVSFNRPFSIVGNSLYLFISDETFIWKYTFSTSLADTFAGPFTTVRGLWLTTDSNIYFAETGIHRIRMANSGAGITSIAGNGIIAFGGDNDGALAASLNTPQSVYANTNGQVFIADYGNHRIRFVDTNGIISTFAGNGIGFYNGDNIPATLAGIQYPFDVKGDTLGRIFIADNGNHRIRVVSTTKIISTYIGTGFPGGSAVLTGLITPINSPLAIWVDSQSNVYFCEADSGGIGDSIRRTVISSTLAPSPLPVTIPSNVVVRLVGGSLVPGYSFGPATVAQISPIGLMGDTSGNFYLCEGSIYIIRMIQASTGEVVSFGGSGVSSGNIGTAPIGEITFNYPVSIAGAANSIFAYISDQKYIWKHNMGTGIVTVFAGTATPGFAGDGTAPSNAQLCNPYGVWFTTGGDVYISDDSNNRIRKVTGNIISTIAGTGISCTSGSYRGDGNLATSTLVLLNNPKGIYVDTSGKIFIADYANHRIRVIATDNIISTYSGNGGCIYNGDNIPATLASICFPKDVKGDSLGNIYITDTNCFIRMVNPAGIIVNFIGNGICAFSSSADGPLSGSIIAPVALWLDSRAELYWSDGRAIRRTFTIQPPTSQPSSQPTRRPTTQPSSHPSSQPSRQPTRNPTSQPSRQPSSVPSTQPIVQPTGTPSAQPSKQPSSCPSSQPSSHPTMQPTRRPSSQPTTRPSGRPSAQPTCRPSSQPTGQPTSRPSRQPSSSPTSQPTRKPSSQPTGQPTAQPSRQPSSRPSNQPSSTPSAQPSRQPSSCPSMQPSSHPSSQPTRRPTKNPTAQPSNQPSSCPSSQPSSRPTMQPTRRPSSQPTTRPSGHPSAQPTCRPSSQPTGQPTSRPSRQPSSSPTSQPTRKPSSQPTGQPTAQPSRQPSSRPSRRPSSQPTNHPTSQPSCRPSVQPSRKPSGQPSSRPSNQPTVQPSSKPSRQPTVRPTTQPSRVPTNQPSSQPTAAPTQQPSSSPSAQPSIQPTTQPSVQPSLQPSNQPTVGPSSLPTTQPTLVPSSFPSQQPSSQPTVIPSSLPSSCPSLQPTGFPTTQPTGNPTTQPSSLPSSFPSNRPTVQPSSSPSSQPTALPSTQPTVVPSDQPTSQPSVLPSTQPTMNPTTQPSSFPSNKPTSQPSSLPSVQPTSVPTTVPSSRPSTQPIGRPTSQPLSFPTSVPTRQPSSVPSSQPSQIPTVQPSGFPSSQPSSLPSFQPVSEPTVQPSSTPSAQPSGKPSSQPSSSPSAQPRGTPSSRPTTQPSTRPSTRPSSQPTSSPSAQPRSRPSSQPTSQPTMIPTAQPFANPTSAPVATIYQTNGVLFLLGTTTGVNQSKADESHSNNDFLGSSFVLFGRNYKSQKKFPFRISLSSSSSEEFVSEIHSGHGGIRNDISTRSTTIIGDVNGDGFDDLLVGYPLACKCSIYLGDAGNDFTTIIATTGESFAIVGDPYEGGGFLGWSTIRVGDVNGDSFEEIVVSAIYANTVYIIFGRTHFNKTMNINELSSKDGFKIIGGNQDINFGLSMTFVHHFHNIGHRDIAVTAQTPSGGQNIIYILFGTMIFSQLKDISLDSIKNNPNYCFRIIAPLYSFAGLSLAGVGDINKDGYDDLAIGSVPYNRGQYGEQMTFIIFGRDTGSLSSLFLSEMTEKDGFIIIGGGFLVTGVSDINSDGVADLMITNFFDWQGQRNAYLIISPKNMTYSPSLQPTSMPSTLKPTIVPTLSPSLTNSTQNGSTLMPSASTIPTRLPTVQPTAKPSISPTRELFLLATAPPSTRKPTVSPSLVPTRFLRTRYPTVFSSVLPTLETTVYTMIDCSESTDCQANEETNNAFHIKPVDNFLDISGSNAGQARNLYILYPPSDPNHKKVVITIENFRTSTDVLDLSHLTGFSYSSLNDITYSFVKENLFFSFCSDTLQVILVSHSSFDLEEKNFIFSPVVSDSGNNQNQSKHQRRNAFIQIGIIGGVGIIVFHFFVYLSRKGGKEEKEKNKHEEKLLESLDKPLEEELDEEELILQDDLDGEQQQIEYQETRFSPPSNSAEQHYQEEHMGSFRSVASLESNGNFPILSHTVERSEQFSEESFSSASSFNSLLNALGLESSSEDSVDDEEEEKKEEADDNNIEDDEEAKENSNVSSGFSSSDDNDSHDLFPVDDPGENNDRGNSDKSESGDSNYSNSNKSSKSSNNSSSGGSDEEEDFVLNDDDENE
jgi:sugar lactone lactonase YvrE